MNNIEQNALRIAELLGWNPDSRDNNVYNIVIENRGYNEWLRQPQYAIVKTFSSYNGLMPLVFECNKSSTDITIDIDCNDVILTQYKSNYKLVCTYGIYEEQTFIKTEETFIEALQQAVIKYLELKNDSGTN